eukprot:TRINITY_DN39431_c0_g1_i2.p1 TRINITY_DN39431_c0_g1~~TRINITY_DN39431_c0_g1_i2.p1  ORF type:complete len:327 (+),score=28.57 TRINITY_DN39431_c0_g1_i2:250-1230(+)
MNSVVDGRSRYLLTNIFRSYSLNIVSLTSTQVISSTQEDIQKRISTSTQRETPCISPPTCSSLSVPSSRWLLSLTPSAAREGIWYPNVRQISSEPESRIVQAKALLTSANAVALRARIEAEGEVRMALRYKEFVDMCIEDGFADTQSEAVEMCKAMHTAGVILKHCNTVYLRPEEVAEMVLDALPDTEDEIETKIQKLEQELLPLQQRKAQCDRKAEFWSLAFIWGGFVFLVCQFMVFFNFTFFTYSWDVMEPVTYFAGQVLVLLGYIYFLTTKEEFGFQNITDKLRTSFYKKSQQRERFDVERYNKLLRDVQRWQRYLKRFKHLA